MPDILWFSLNVADSCAAPVVGARCIHIPLLCSHTAHPHVIGRAFNFVISKDTSNLTGTMPFHAQPKNALDNCGGFLADQPAVLVE